MPTSFASLLDHHRLVVLHGATGTFLQQLGLPLSQSPESWVLENPTMVYTAAEAYVNAGSDVILTCTFGGTAARLQEARLEAQAFEVNKHAAEIAREAANG